MRSLALSLTALFAFALPLRAADEAARLGAALRLPEVAQILFDEGVRYGKDIDSDMLGGEGGEHFAGQVARIYEPQRMTDTMLDQLAQNMNTEQMTRALEFLDAPLGVRIMQLELTARQAMSDEAVAEFAKEAEAKARAEGVARLDLIDRFVKVNELIDRNVAGALASNYRFFQGLSAAGPNKMSEGEMMDRVWEQEESIRADTLAWMNGYLYMAYGPLTDDELSAYIAFSETPEGQALNVALFTGFDAVFDRIHYDLGQAAARTLASHDL
ncbi:MAG: DUF2059 domain-containing protein [Pseudooceanicola sp.]|nr:DUF2059 domain-containing protein [Pseudooceanicola sp.]